MKKIHLISYPRSGNTWVRFLIANIQHPEMDIGYRELDSLVPDLHQEKSWKEEDINWSPVVYKAHDMFRSDYEKVIYIYRDGRDVALSCYRFYQGEWNHPRRRFNGSFSEYLERFVAGKNRFGGWEEHVNFWINNIMNAERLLIKYEDLLTDPHLNLHRIVKFLEINSNYSKIASAVEKSTYAKLKARAPGDGQHPYSYGTKGCSGGWKKEFTREQKKIFQRYAGDLLWKLEYEK